MVAPSFRYAPGAATATPQHDDDAAAVVAAKVPTGHRLHSDTPPALQRPTGQAVQAADPVVAAKYPAAHAVQAVTAPAAENRPLAHGTVSLADKVKGEG